MELVVWAEGTGAAFGQPMLGSPAYIGEVALDVLGALRNAAGQTYLEAGAPYGVTPENLANDVLRATASVGAAEVHPEEGGFVWNVGLSVGLVKAVDGRRLYTCTVTGNQADAGSTPMPDRQDALAGAAAMIVAMERLARELGKDAVITVGRILAQPNVDDLIAGEVTFSIDFRHPSTRVLVNDDQTLRERILDVATHRGLTATIDPVSTYPAIEMNAGVRGKATKGLINRGIAELMIETTTGVAHEAAMLARRIPAVMFLAAANPGASRTTQEYSRPEDLQAAAAALFETVRDRKLE
jgi:N-carbamoyl-L-amino-acid hydrolase